MHKTLIKKASDEQLRSFVDDALTMLKETNYETYKDLERYLYKEVYGNHFSEWLLEQAVSKMVNEDGTAGAHWTLSETNQVAKNNGILFTHYNEYDFNYVMNMMYSDYYGAVSNDTNMYFRMAKKFLEDKDAKEGKAFCYYMAMQK